MSTIQSETTHTGAPIPSGERPVRLSLGAQSRIRITSSNGQPCYVLFINKKRLTKNNPEYGLIGGGVEFTGVDQKVRLQKEFDISDDSFEQAKPLDVRISGIREDQLPQVVNTIVNGQLIQPDRDILREFSEEMQEIEEVSRVSNGVIQASNYSGPEVTAQHLSNSQLMTLPLAVSGRSGELSQRVQIVYDINPPPELVAYILQNSSVLTREVTTADKPFLLIPESQINELIELFNGKTEETVTLPVKFGNSGMNIGVSSLVKLLSNPPKKD